MNGSRYEELSQCDETANRGQVLVVSVSELLADAKPAPPGSKAHRRFTCGLEKRSDVAIATSELGQEALSIL